MSEDAEDTYYLGELRHALTNIVRQGPANALTGSTHIDSPDLFLLEQLLWRASLHPTEDPLRRACLSVLIRN